MSRNQPRSHLSRYISEITRFANDLLEPYLRRIENSKVSPQRKEVNDPVWKTLVFFPLEVVVIDSPLLQRLRRIRQLGVAHLVYPGATHTRFEHSLGTVHQIQALVDGINSGPADKPSIINTSMTRLLRLAALCHDIGHGVMSHVSENALRNLAAVEDIRLDFAETAETADEPPRISELTAHLMVGSSKFKEMIQLVKDRTTEFGIDELPKEIISKIQKAIVGQPISDTMPLLHELISGPFDADKLDYMPRDAQMAGVPVVTDIPRLIQKVRAVTVKQEHLPERIRNNVAGGKPGYTIIGIARSGGRTLDELMLGRTLLHDKIYRHHKVRAVETMVASILLNIGQIIEKPPGIAAYMLMPMTLAQQK